MTPARVLLLLALVTPGTASPADARSKWWFDPSLQQYLGLTTAQVRIIDDIFESTRDQRLMLRTRMEHATDDLTRAMTSGDEQTCIRLAGVLTEAQSAHARARQLMLVRMLRALTPAQRKKLPNVTAILGRQPDAGVDESITASTSPPQSHP